MWGFLACANLAVSQNNEKITDTLEIQEVVVTHSKIPLSRRQTIKPVRVITRQQIEQGAGKDLAQVLQEQTGMLINGAYSNPSKDKSIYTQGAANEFTLVLVDSQPMTDPSGFGGSFDLRLFSLGQIERIEILQGSQSTLYGSDAIAGVINIITRKSGEKKTGAYGALSYGSYHSFRANAGINGALNNFDYNINLDKTTTDGISEAAAENPSDKFEKDGSGSLGFQANLGYAVSKAFHVKPFIRYTDYGGDFDDGAFADAQNRYEARVINPGVQAVYQSKKSYSNLSYGYTNIDRSFQSGFGLFEYKGRFHNLDALFNYKLNNFVQVFGGVNFQGLQMLDSTTLVVDPSETIVSPSLNFILKAFEKLNAEAGFRYNRHSGFGSNANYSASLSYRFTENFKAYGAYTTGFKAPVLFQLFGQFGANENLGPEKSTAVETGVEFQALNNSLRLGANFFSRKIKDAIAYDFAKGYINQDEQNDRGIDVEIAWEINDKLGVKGHYSYLTGEITTVNSSNQTTAFHNLFRRPKHSFFADFQYRPIPKLLLSVQAQRIGKRDDLFFNPDNFFTEETVNLGAYLLLNVYADFKLMDEKLAVFADLKNILNTDFVEVYGFNALGLSFQSGLRFRL